MLCIYVALMELTNNMWWNKGEDAIKANFKHKLDDMETDW